MRPTTLGFYSFCWIVASVVVTLFIVTLSIAIVTAFIAYAQIGTLKLSFDDVIYAVRVGIAGGIPLGAGAWLLAKLKVS